MSPDHNAPAGAAPTAERPEVVLVGGGHSHVQVLRHWMMHPREDCRLTLVVDQPVAVYSGMVPGFVAGQYGAEELEIDVLPLARRAGARAIVAAATGIDPKARRIELDGRPSIPYDLASIDIGSTVAGLELPGVREHAIPTRPIGLFVRRLDEVLSRAAAWPEGDPFPVVVVGGGVGGVELAFSIERRIAGDTGKTAAVRLLEIGPRILPRYPDSLIAKLERKAAERGITISCDSRVVEATAEGVRLESGEELRAGALLWVTGAVGHPVLRGSDLPFEERGFVRTEATLQVEGHPELFGVGDCATMNEFPETPKAGVYAVRQGPPVTRNLIASLEGRELERYRPQGDFLALLNLGDGTAIGAKWGISAAGSKVMRLKDWIDVRFMRKFQVLRSDGSETEEFAEMAMEEAGGKNGMDGPMLCGGCASKVGQATLLRALERVGAGASDPTVEVGLGQPDDAAAYSTPSGDRVTVSVDGFKAFTDDPYLVGRVAAVNAVSDLHAKGVRPRYAQAWVTVPELESDDAREEELFQVLAGVRAALDPLGVSLVGGHSTTGAELVVGLSVEGVGARDEPWVPLSGLRAGQRLILTKPLGTGVIFHADMHGRARGPWVEAAIESMLRPNAEAARIAVELGATGATDVTGFGLVGHAGEMARSSAVSAWIDLARVPALPGAEELLGLGLRSTFHPENERARRGIRVEDAAARDPRLPLLFDPQTSGGLLFGVPSERAAEAVRRLHEAGDTAAAEIGEVSAAFSDGAPLGVR